MQNKIDWDKTDLAETIAGIAVAFIFAALTALVYLGII